RGLLLRPNDWASGPRTPASRWRATPSPPALAGKPRRAAGPAPASRLAVPARPPRRSARTCEARYGYRAGHEGDDEPPDDDAAITQWTTVVLHPDELGWLREALALNADEDDDGEDLEPL